jgi:hypothetical protein
MRRVGIALIAFPELITTPFGVALLVTAQVLSRRVEANLNKRLRNTVQQLFTHLSHFSHDGKASALKKEKNYSRYKEYLFPWRRKNKRDFETNSSPAAWHSWRQKEPDAVFHSIDMEALSRRYETENSLKVGSAGANVPGATKQVFHNLDMKALSRRYEATDSSKSDPDGIDASGTTKQVFHNIDIRALSRRFKDDSNGDTNSQNPDTQNTVHHTLNQRLLSQQYDTKEDIPVKVQYHAVNIHSLLRRYGSAPGHALSSQSR